MKTKTKKLLVELGFNPETVNLKEGSFGKLRNKKVKFVFLPPSHETFNVDGMICYAKIYKYII
jgi:hypothetical protein